MSKSKSVLFSALLLAAAPLASTAFAEDAPVETPAAQDPAAAASESQTPAAQDPAAAASESQTPAAQEPAAAAPESQTPTAPEDQTAAQAQAPTEEQQATPQRDPAHPYEIQYFFADFQRFTIGSVVPDRYRTKKYEIVDWKTRNLPAPAEGSNWTYMGGNYVLISKADGRILKAESGDIFYKQ